jgi:hypothetical protein
MSPELETLDQLLGGDLPLVVIQSLYPDFDAFRRGVCGLLSNGDAKLIEQDGNQAQEWRWIELFAEASDPEKFQALKLSITPQGTRRIA